MPEATLSNPNIDYLIFGEGEYIWQDFLRALESGDTRWGDISGLWYKEDGKVVPAAAANRSKTLTRCLTPPATCTT